MTEKNRTEIVFIIDRSGSMEMIKDDAIGGFNNFLEEQRKLPGEATVTLVMFDHEYEISYQSVDLGKVEPLTERTYVPRGTTALLDAVGRTINDVEARMAKAEDRPDKVMICILTDGMENASREFSKDRIKEMIEGKRKDQGWEFAFLAANQDAFQEGGNLGIALNMIANFKVTKEGTKGAFHHMNVLTTDYRTKDRSR